MSKFINRLSIRKSFTGKMFASLVIVSAIPAILAGTLLVNLFRTQLEYEYEKDAREQAAAVSEAVCTYLEGTDAVIGKILSDDTIIKNIDNTDSWEKNRAYTALYSDTEGYRNTAGFNVYDKDGELVFTTENSGGIEALPTYFGILKIAYTHPEKLVIRRAVLPHNRDVLLQLTRAVYADEECVGFVVVNVRSEDFKQILDKTYDMANGLSIIDSFYEEIYSYNADITGNLATLVRDRRFRDESLNNSDDEFGFIVEKIGDTELILILGKEPVLTDSITKTMWNVVIVIVLASMILCLLVALVFSHAFSKPVREMTKAMDRVKKGDLDTLINSKRTDELGQLSDEFDRMTAELKNYMELQTRQQQEINDSNIAMMQAQLNPHFLYNTLDTIKWAAKANQVPDIAKMAADLAQILRMSISETKFVTLSEEIEFVEKYVEIQQIRFGGNFTFDVELPMELEDCIVPKLIVQPIVENAVIHGLKEQDKGHIFVNVFEKNECLTIEVSDNGVGIDEDVIARINSRNRENFRGHLGFFNVDTIIKLYYGENYGVKAERPAAGGTMISIILPVNKQGETND